MNQLYRNAQLHFYHNLLVFWSTNQMQNNKNKKRGYTSKKKGFKA